MGSLASVITMRMPSVSGCRYGHLSFRHLGMCGRVPVCIPTAQGAKLGYGREVAGWWTRCRRPRYPVPVSDGDDHLSGVAPAEEEAERLAGPLEALDDVLAVVDLPLHHPAGHLELGGGESVEVVQDEEALHAVSYTHLTLPTIYSV